MPRKRYESRRIATTHSHKDSTSYPASKRASSNSVSKSYVGKENEKRNEVGSESNKGM